MKTLKTKLVGLFRRIQWFANVGNTSINSLVVKMAKKNIAVFIAAKSVDNSQTHVVADERDSLSFCPNCNGKFTILTWWQEKGSIRVYYRFCISCHVEYAR